MMISYSCALVLHQLVYKGEQFQAPQQDIIPVICGSYHTVVSPNVKYNIENTWLCRQYAEFTEILLYLVRLIRWLAAPLSV